MDNASFRKSQRARELIEAIGLPPANMKRWIKAHISNFGILYNALELFYNAQISMLTLDIFIFSKISNAVLSSASERSKLSSSDIVLILNPVNL